MTALGPIALDGEEVPAPANGDDWRMEWHPPPSAPPGQPHGANGHEKGLVLVRSIWRAEVTLGPWRPQHEIPFRRTIPASDLAGHLWIEPGAGPIYARAAREAGLTLRRHFFPAPYEARSPGTAGWIRPDGPRTPKSSRIILVVRPITAKP